MGAPSNQSIVCLADVLARENVALAAMDLPRAAALLAEKTAAIAALAALRLDPAMVSAARRLDDLARENRRLLERALVAQERVVGIVARAAASIEPAYGARGRGARPVALSTRV